MKILKKNFKKIVGISIACMWALTNTVGCSPIEAEETGANNAGSKPANEAGPSSQTTTQPASVASANATKLIFWHSMGGLVVKLLINSLSSSMPLRMKLW